MIRKYTPADCGEVMEVWAAASAIAHPFLSREFLEQERRTIPAEHLPKADTWVWEEDGRVVGFLSLLGNEVGALFVDPEFQRSGIGRALLDRARALPGELEVDVFRENAIGRAFYAKQGFEPVPGGDHEQAGHEVLRLRLTAGTS